MQIQNILKQLLIICLISCSDTTTSDVDYDYTIPVQSLDGWETTSLSEVGMKEEPIAQFMNEILNNIDHKIHSILIVKEGKLVFEEYFSGYKFYNGPFTAYDGETKHDLASVTKSFTSALVGIAIDQGFIQSVDQKVFSFFPEYNDLNNEEKDKITIEHLLTMTSGLEWDESTYPYTDPRNDLYQIWYEADPIEFILEKPIVTEPGTQFHYSSSSTNVLGEIIQKTTGMRADDFCKENLFTPLKIDDYKWSELLNDVLYTSGDLKLRPRDMAKLGDLYLNNGVWGGEHILSESWIAESTGSFIAANSKWDYGYQWWLSNYEINSEQIKSFAAKGWGGQNIVVFPSLDMVVVTTAGYHDDPQLEFHIDILMMENILNAVNSITSK